MTLYVSDVPSEHLESISALVRAELRRIADVGVDMERLEMVLRRERRQTMHSLEGRPESMVEQSAIGGKSPSSLPGRANPKADQTWLCRFQICCTATRMEISFRRRGRSLTSTTPSQAGPGTLGLLSSGSAPSHLLSHHARLSVSDLNLNLILRYLVDAPTITIVGKPSAALAKSIEKAEKARIDAQKKALGEDGLAAKEKELQLAKDFNDRDIPREVLERFTVPDVSVLLLTLSACQPERVLTFAVVSCRSRA